MIAITPKQAIAALKSAGYIVKVWTDEDIESVITGYYKDMNPFERQAIVSAVRDNWWWKELGRSTSEDWKNIDTAIVEEANRLGIDIGE